MYKKPKNLYTLLSSFAPKVHRYGINNCIQLIIKHFAPLLNATVRELGNDHQV